VMLCAASPVAHAVRTRRSRAHCAGGRAAATDMLGWLVVVGAVCVLPAFTGHHKLPEGRVQCLWSTNAA
jgi:hypothetical protein